MAGTASPWSTAYLQQQGLDPQKLSTLLGVSVDEASTLVQAIENQGVAINTLSSHIGMSPEETVLQLENLQARYPQGLLLDHIRQVTDPYITPVVGFTPHWQNMTSVQFDTTHQVDTTLQDALVSSGPDAFVGVAATQLSIKKRLLWKFANTLAEQAQSAARTHQTFLDTSKTSLLKLEMECDMLGGYGAAAGVLLVQNSPHLNQSNANPRTRVFQGGYGGLDDLLRLLLIIAALATIAAIILTIAAIIDDWIRGMNLLHSSQADSTVGNQASDSNEALAQLYADLYAKDYGISSGALKDLVEKLLDEGVDVNDDTSIAVAIGLYKKGVTNTQELAKFIKQADTLLAATPLGALAGSAAAALSAEKLDLAAEMYKKGMTDGTALANAVATMTPQQVSQTQSLMKNIPAMTAADVLQRVKPYRTYSPNEGKRGSIAYNRGDMPVSAEPKNAAKVLENAVSIPGPTKRLIGVDTSTDEIIVYDENSDKSEGKLNDYHSHIESINELKGTKKIYRDTLEENGLIDKTGHIIIRDANGKQIGTGPHVK